MAVLSLLVYKADEYMEGVLERQFGAHDLEDISVAIKRELVLSDYLRSVASTSMADDRRTDGTSSIFDDRRGGQAHSSVESQPVSGEQAREQASECSGDETGSFHAVRRAVLILNRFASHIMGHLAVQSSPPAVQSRIAFELEAFLSAHIAQAQDNYKFCGQINEEFSGQTCTGCHGVTGGLGRNQNGDEPVLDKTHEQTTIYPYTGNPGHTFYRWARSTSADHTSCPFAFVFFSCLLGFGQPQTTASPAQIQELNQRVLQPRPRRHYKPTIFTLDARTSHVAEDMVRHLSSLCRMYNDVGSCRRDCLEKNLNSVNFPEFHRSQQFTSIPETGNTERVKTGTGHNADKPNCHCGGVVRSSDEIKQELMQIAQYERRGLEAGMRELEICLLGCCSDDRNGRDREMMNKLAPASEEQRDQWDGKRGGNQRPQPDVRGCVGSQETGEQILRGLRFFVDVTDLYGQIYVLRDYTGVVSRRS